MRFLPYIRRRKNHIYCVEGCSTQTVLHSLVRGYCSARRPSFSAFLLTTQSFILRVGLRWHLEWFYSSSYPHSRPWRPTLVLIFDIDGGGSGAYRGPAEWRIVIITVTVSLYQLHLLTSQPFI